MSAAKRFVSGSLAGWASILVVVVNQLALVPLYLTYWSVTDYGIWLAIQAFISLCTVFSFGYLSYVEVEFLHFDDKNKNDLGKFVSSSALVVFFVAIFELLLIVLLVKCGGLSYFIYDNEIADNLKLERAGYLLIVQMIGYGFFTIVPNVLQRALIPFGYYPRNAWWYTSGMVVSTIAMVAAVVSGADFLDAGIFQVFVYSVFSSFLVWNTVKIFQEEGVLFSKPVFSLGFKAFIPSVALATKTFLIMLNQHGIRVLLASVLGVRELASFSSMRTVNNVALQGIGTVINPLSPELIKCSNSGDSEKTSLVFNVIWIFIVFFLGIFLVIFQLVVPMLFDVWTLKKIQFDPLVFAGLSISLLIYALSQPMFLIVKGFNNLSFQLLATASGAFFIVSCIFFLTAEIGLMAAVAGLLLAELVSLAIYIYGAVNIMREKGLVWPTYCFNMAFLFSIISAVGMCVAAMPFVFSEMVLAFVFLIQGVLFCFFVKKVLTSVGLGNKLLFWIGGK